MVQQRLVIVDDFYCNADDVAKLAHTTTYDTKTRKSIDRHMYHMGVQDFLQRYMASKIRDFDDPWVKGGNPDNGRFFRFTQHRTTIPLETDRWDWWGVLFLNRDPVGTLVVDHNGTQVRQLYNRLVLFKPCAGDTLTWEGGNGESCFVQLFCFNTNPQFLTPQHDQMVRALQRYHILDNALDHALCDRVVTASEAWAAENGGNWTTQRHRNYPTTDIPVDNLPESLTSELKSIVHERVFPAMERYFLFPAASMSLKDFFVIKYDVEGQRELKWHRDVSMLSFNFLLNDASEFEGGGTRFQLLDETVGIEKGQALLHTGALLHAGNAVTRGIRYIIVGFVHVDSDRIDRTFRKEAADRVTEDKRMLQNIFRY